MRLLTQLAVGIVLSGLIAGLAYWRGSLTKSGGLGAMLVGTLIFGFGGWAWGALLIVFFVSSTLLSHYKEGEKSGLAEKFEKGSQRDFGQALANGGAAALIAALSAALPGPVMLAAFTGALATVNADTWATELGVLSKRPPRLVKNGKVVEYGTSGGVSALGTLASLGGGLLIGLAAALLIGIDARIGGRGFAALPLLIPTSLVAGLAGSLFDSVLGATVQSIYYCPTCRKETEKKLHTCGTPTEPLRGWPWLDNDLVNLISSLVGALAAGALWWVFTR
jgi:uncharacterized protein (TIGR00297 family)